MVYGSNGMGKSPRAKRWFYGGLLILIVFMGLAARLALAYHGGNKPVPWGDEWQYVAIGRNLVEGHGYSVVPDRPTALRVPVTSLLVSAIYATGKHELVRARIAWSFLDMLNLYLVVVLALLISRNRLVALLAAAGYSLHPLFPMMASKVMSETPFTLLFLASLVLLVSHWYTRSWWTLCLSAVTVGLSMLSRPTSALFPILVVLLIILGARREHRPWLARAAVYLLLIAVVLLPWVVRNQLVFKEFIPLSTFGAAPFWCGAGAGPNGTQLIGPWCDERTRQATTKMREMDADRFVRREAVRIARSHPLHWLGLAVERFFSLWFRMFKSGWTSPLGIMLAIANAVMLWLGWMGIRKTGQPMVTRTFLAVFIYFSFLHMISYAELRYSMPAYAFILPFTAVGLVDLLSRFSPAMKNLTDEVSV